MQYNLTKLHQQFQQKHHELSQITGKIDTFMQIYKPKIEDKKTVKYKLKKLADGLKNIKQEFKIVKNDLATYGQLPNQFVRMVVELPGIYQAFWDNREIKLRRSLQAKDEENQILKQKITDKDQQLNELKLRLALKENQIKHHKAMQNKPSHLNIETFFNESKNLQTKDRPRIGQGEEEDLDEYINNMEITIKEHDEPLFKKITEQESQEEEQEQQSNTYHKNEKKNNTARSNLMLDYSDDTLRAQPIRKRSQHSFLQQNKNNFKNTSKNLPKPEEMITKCTFWNKLSKNLNPKTKSGKSMSKENIQNRQNRQSSNKINKLSVAEKKILTSKITDFRKMLFMEKGIQRFSFRVDN